MEQRRQVLIVTAILWLAVLTMAVVAITEKSWKIAGIPLIAFPFMAFFTWALLFTKPRSTEGPKRMNDPASPRLSQPTDRTLRHIFSGIMILGWLAFAANYLTGGSVKVTVAAIVVIGIASVGDFILFLRRRAQRTHTRSL